jgi:O-antigen ligase
LGLGVLATALPSGRGVGTLASLAQRVRQFGESASRQHIWRAAWDIFRDHPLVGAGLDTFQIAFADKRTVAYWNLEWNGSPTRAHNEGLNILATQGLLGGLAILVLVAGVVIATRRARNSIAIGRWSGWAGAPRRSKSIVARSRISLITYPRVRRGARWVNPERGDRLPLQPRVHQAIAQTIAVVVLEALHGRLVGDVLRLPR